jgi:hypothetical protein
MKTCLLVVALAVCGLGQNTTTNQLGNGRLWKAIAGEAPKTAYLAGYLNGITFALGSTPPTKGQSLEENLKSINELRSRLFPFGLTVNEVKTALDRFYDTPENLPIPIANALTIISGRASGIDEPTLQQMIANLRRDASN